MLAEGTPFYLAINNMSINLLNLKTWYKCSPLGKHSIDSFMKKMCEASGIKGKKTNHSLRKTTCTKLLHAGVAPTLIQQVTGHKNVASISNYAVASKLQQKNMQDILASRNPSTPSASMAKCASICSAKDSLPLPKDV